MKSDEPSIEHDEQTTGQARSDAELHANFNRKKKRRILIAFSALVVVGAIVAAVWLLSGSADDIFDPDAKSGQAPYKTQEEIQAELDRVVEEGMFNISIASMIEFENGTSPGTAYIENVPGNRYLMQVTIALDDTDETVYESKAIKPGQYIETIALATDLEQGVYAATATFSALDAESHEEIGQAAAKVSLNILG